MPVILIIVWWLIKIFGTVTLVGMLGTGFYGVVAYVWAIFSPVPWYLTPWGIGGMVVGGVATIGAVYYYWDKFNSSAAPGDWSIDKKAKFESFKKIATQYENGEISKEEFERLAEKLL